MGNGQSVAKASQDELSAIKKHLKKWFKDPVRHVVKIANAQARMKHLRALLSSPNLPKR
jgi:hypothetical protein